uniref:Uncharacterized protein n=1 Tax=Anopheles atroparvus TaxID=41427 RepID=A0A182JMQ8_ANOAO
MFNSNLSLTVPSLLVMEGGTPRTPEILNSLMAMTNPLDYAYPVNTSQNSLNDSHSNSSDSPLDSPASHQHHQHHSQHHHLLSGKTPSVQQTCSQLIKEGVKLLIQNKRKHSGGDSSDGNESSTPKTKMVRRRETSMTDHRETSEDDMDSKASPRSTVALTPEDEDRRRRRRERNKIAATKCRMKKRERTVNLINESETLDAQNKELKSQVSKLETERRKLLEVLQAHGPTCVHQKGYQPLPSLSTITVPASTAPSSGNNGKYLSDLNYLDPGGNQEQATTEIKYSECLKSVVANANGSQMDAATGTLLPPGYCKLSPTESTSFLLDASTELTGDGDTYPQPKSEFILGSVVASTPSPATNPSRQQTKANGRAKPGPKPRQSRNQQNSTKATPAAIPVTTNVTSLSNSATTVNSYSNNSGSSTGKGNPLIAATLMTTTPASSPSSVASPLTVASSVSSVGVLNPMVGLGAPHDDDDFILKSELIDTNSPYTTVQSADRFLFDATLDLYNNNAHSPLTGGLNCGSSQHQQQQHHHHHLQQHQQHNGSLNNNNPSLLNENDKLNHLNAIKDNTSNTLLEFSASFDSLKPSTVDYTQRQQQQPQQQQQQQQHQQHQQPLQHSNGMHHHQQQPLGSLLGGDPTLGHLLHHHQQQQHHQHHHQQQQQQQQHHHQHHLQQQQHQQQLQQHHLQQQQQQLHQQQHQQQQQLVNSALDLLGPVTNEFLLLADDDPSEFTDLDSSITAYNSINGCLA